MMFSFQSSSSDIREFTLLITGHVATEAVPPLLSPAAFIVRRQNIWHNWLRKLAELGPRLGIDV
jgi:hypothetical protein